MLNKYAHQYTLIRNKKCILSVTRSVAQLSHKYIPAHIRQHGIFSTGFSSQSHQSISAIVSVLHSQGRLYTCSPLDIFLDTLMRLCFVNVETYTVYTQSCDTCLKGKVHGSSEPTYHKPSAFHL